MGTISFININFPLPIITSLHFLMSVKIQIYVLLFKLYLIYTLIFYFIYFITDKIYKCRVYMCSHPPISCTDMEFSFRSPGSILFQFYITRQIIDILYQSMNMCFLPSKILILVAVFSSLPWLPRHSEISFQINSSLYSLFLLLLFISPFLCLWSIVLTMYLFI